jgi:hypothetical protein
MGMKNARRFPRPEFNTLTGRFEYSEAEARYTADRDARHLARIREQNAAAAGMTVDEYLSQDHFAVFA